MTTLIHRSTPCTKCKNASITVFMSLCLSICILLIGTALKSARFMMLRWQISRAAESALDSVFAAYDGDLFDEFGVLLLNTEDLSDFSSLEDLIEEYAKAELDTKNTNILFGGNFFREEFVRVNILSLTTATQRQGECFARSVLDYMKYHSSVELFQKVQSELFEVQGAEEKKNDRMQILEENRAAMQEINSEEQEKTEKKNLQESEKMVDKSFLGDMKKVQRDGVLSLVLPAGFELSDKRVTKSGFPSNYYTGSDKYAGILSDQVNNILYSEYLLEHFYDFTSGKGNGSISYELEYILFGSGIDRENMKSCVNRILAIREAMNLTTILSSPNLKAQARSFATGLVGWTGIAPLIEAVCISAEAAWAFGEAILDVRTLLGGGKVPLKKTEAEWTLSLMQLSDLFKGRLKGAESYEDGMDYQDYLRILSMLTGDTGKYYRTMDMIQCRLNDYKPRFYMKECAYELQIEIVAEAKPLFLGAFFYQKKNNGKYSLSVSASRMY